MGRTRTPPPPALDATNRYKYDEIPEGGPVRFTGSSGCVPCLIILGLFDPGLELALCRSACCRRQLRDPANTARTLCAWFVDIVFVTAGCFINKFFNTPVSVPTYPVITVSSNMPSHVSPNSQTLIRAFPAGKLANVPSLTSGSPVLATCGPLTLASSSQQTHCHRQHRAFSTAHIVWA